MLINDNLSNKKPVVKAKSAPKIRKYTPQKPVWRGMTNWRTMTKAEKKMVIHQLDTWE